MIRFKDIQIKRKLLLSMGIILTISVVVFAMAYALFLRVGENQHKSKRMVSGEVYFIRAAQYMQRYFSEYDGNESNPSYRLIRTYIDSAFTLRREIRAAAGEDADLSTQESVYALLESIRQSKSQQQQCDARMTEVANKTIATLRAGGEIALANLEAMEMVRLQCS